MRHSSSKSRSRSKGNKRGGQKRSSQDRGSYKRSFSRSDSRGKDSKRGGGDFNSRRRNKFSDPSQNGGSSQRGGFSSGFNDSNSNQRNDDRGYQSGNGGFGSKGGQQYGSRNDNGYKGDQNGNGGFSYNNVRNSQGPNMNEDIDRILQNSKPESSYNRNQYDRSSNGVGFNNNFSGNSGQGSSYDNYQISTSSLRQSSSKTFRKVPIPQDGKFNYIGLIIGPKGSKQKQLEEMTHCKILIRGKGSQKQGAPQQPDDNEDLHVLIEADSEMNANKAMKEIENIIFMDDDQKVKLRDQQLKSNYNGGQQHRPDGQYNNNNDRQTFIQIPKDVVGLVIGKKGETIKQIKEKSGADKVYMQPENQRNQQDDSYQNLIVEGSASQVERVRELVNDIKNQQQQKKQGYNDNFNNNNFNNRGGNQKQEARIEMEIPANLAGLVIGSKGSTLQQVGSETRTRCQINQNNNDNRKILIIVGNTEEDCQRAKEIFQEKMNSRMAGNQNDRDNNQRGGGFNNRGNNNSSRGGGRTFNNRRPRKNADDDEIVEAYQFESYPTYNLEEQMMHSQQMLLNMQNFYNQQGQYPPQQQVPPAYGNQQQQQPSDSYAVDSKPGQSTDNLTNTNISTSENNTVNSISPQPQQQAATTEFQQYPQPYGQAPGYDPNQVQMQISQYLQYQQMYLQTQSYTGPVIEEVLADGTIVSLSQNADDKKKGKRGGRR
ncbi:KH domain protein (macronuclear) [Tetrahymena thermophila SB210]|uniref:Branchpoint-bridging protein n=1 Tax=Tetrahymena thermophila (strain SB210) TaxID=312017 RepID=Q23D17_TETTS|nr:KH domain protein [Tetrahymena thermophila SB210]EAR94482.1 KH domain protein [Tetrahymena thermophila SB210]|eukprot:XP_001014869.1 KH domain protein [Tetrahymena thermophila SB210]